MKGRNRTPDGVRDLARPDVGSLDVAPSPPSWLTNETAVEEWNRVAPLLVARGVLSDDDTALLATYCQTYSTYLRCQVAIDSGDVGSREVQSLVRLCDGLLKQIRGMCDAFGFSPSSRARMSVAPSGEGDELLEFV